MSREAVLGCVRLAGAGTDCAALRMLGVAAARMTNASGASWSHAGLLYRSKGKPIFFFELRGHEDLHAEPIEENPGRPSLAWIEPQITPERAKLIVGRCKLVLHAHQERKVPYGFRYGRTVFDERGMLLLGEGEAGLTCATIIDAVFAAEKVPLLDPSKWDAADDDDKRTRRKFIDHLRGADPQRAAVLETEIDAPRIRPEEVVAAAAIHPRLGTFALLVDGAAVVAERLGL